MYNRVGAFFGKEVEIYDVKNGDIIHRGIVTGTVHDSTNPIVAYYDDIVVRASEALHFKTNGRDETIYITEGLDIREVKRC